jgi:methylated-DNA-[protein]-cysteine S-methyltransferase
MMITRCSLDTCIGRLELRADEKALLELDLPGGAAAAPAEPAPPPALRASPRRTGHAVLEQASCELSGYFAGRRRDFSVPIRLEGTPFQLRVWRALATIPFGATLSYAELAERIGDPRAVRAVGAANGRNPLAILLPCHRVIGSDGSLTGFAGGLPLKRWLLDHEARVVSALAPAV